MTLRIIAGRFKGRLLRTPKGAATRPSQSMLREALFNICQHAVDGTRFLDLFAGSGAIGFEALSRGAAHVCFVERDKGAALCIRENIEQLQVQSEAILYPIDYRIALKRLRKNGEPFDIIYVDPPYQQSIKPILSDLLDANLLKPASLLFVEQPSTHSVRFSAPNLSLIASRKFGDALLEQYALAKSIAE